MADCVFCQIVSKKIPNYTVYEDDQILAFLDINPNVEGHTVVIPKRHGELVFDLADEQVGRLFVGVNHAMKRIHSVLSPDGFTVGWNHGAAGGQVVPHLHVHIFPRRRGDGGTSVHAVVRHPAGSSVAEVAKLFSASL